MKNFIRIVLLTVLFWTTPGLIMTSAVLQGNTTKETVKTALANSGIYTQLVTNLDDQVATLFAEQKIKTSKDPLLELIKQEVTPAYIQTKTETFIDDTYYWMTGASNEPPIVSFSDVRDTLLSKYKKQYDQLLFLSKQLKKQQAVIQQAAIEQEDIGTLHEINTIAAFDFEKFLSQDPTIPVGKHIGWVKNVHTAIVSGYPILIGLMGVVSAIIILLSPTWKSRVRWLSLICLVCGVSSLINYGLIMTSSQAIALYLSRTTTSIPSLIQPLIIPLLSPLLLEGARLAKLSTAILLPSAAVLYLLSFQIKKTTAATKA